MPDTSHGGRLKNATLGKGVAGYALGLVPSVWFCANVFCVFSLFSFRWFRIPAPIRSLSVCLKYRFLRPVWTLNHTWSSGWEGVWVPRICISAWIPRWFWCTLRAQKQEDCQILKNKNHIFLLFCMPLHTGIITQNNHRNACWWIFSSIFFIFLCLELCKINNRSPHALWVAC